MKFSSVSRLLHTGRHTGSTGTRGLLTTDAGTTGHWSPHWRGPPPGAAATAPPHHAGAGYKQRAGEPRQCPLYPVSSSTSRCSGGRCGVLRSIHYTLIGMQAAGAGPAPAGHTAPTIPSSQPQTSFPFYMLCPLPLVSSSGAQGREKR